MQKASGSGEAQPETGREDLLGLVDEGAARALVPGDGLPAAAPPAGSPPGSLGSGGASSAQPGDLAAGGDEPEPEPEHHPDEPEPEQLQQQQHEDEDDYGQQQPPAVFFEQKPLKQRIEEDLPGFFLLCEPEEVRNEHQKRNYDSFRQSLERTEVPPNERLLFHYAEPDIIEKIKKSKQTGFDSRLSRPCEYGSGTYFAEHAEYPVSYYAGYLTAKSVVDAKTLERDPSKWRRPDVKIIVAKVALGRCKDFGARCRTARGDMAAVLENKVKRLNDWVVDQKPQATDFCKGPELERSECHQYYDSVTGTEGDLKWVAHPELRKRGKKVGRQFVTFHPNQAIPYYVLTLRRKEKITYFYNEALMMEKKGRDGQEMHVGTEIRVQGFGIGVVVEGWTRDNPEHTIHFGYIVNDSAPKDSDAQYQKKLNLKKDVDSFWWYVESVPTGRTSTRLSLELMRKSTAQTAYQVMQFAKDGLVDKVQLLIDRGVDLDAQDEHGDNALINASLKGHIEVVQALLRAGCDTEVRNKWGFTAYRRARYANKQDISCMLLNAGADSTAEITTLMGRVGNFLGIESEESEQTKQAVYKTSKALTMQHILMWYHTCDDSVKEKVSVRLRQQADDRAKRDVELVKGTRLSVDGMDGTYLRFEEKYFGDNSHFLQTASGEKMVKLGEGNRAKDGGSSKGWWVRTEQECTEPTEVEQPRGSRRALGAVPTSEAWQPRRALTQRAGSHHLEPEPES